MPGSSTALRKVSEAAGPFPSPWTLAGLFRIVRRGGGNDVRACRILASACLIALLYAGPAAGGEGGQPGPKPESDDGWRALFDGRTLAGWEKTDLGDRGEARVEGGRIVLSPGDPMNGVRWTGKFPGLDYEIRLEAMRLEGSDFF